MLPKDGLSIFEMKDLGKDAEVDLAVRHTRAGPEDDAQRIDNFLCRLCKGVPKSHVYRILRSGEVRVNGRRVAPDYRVREGDDVRIPPLRRAQSAAPIGTPPATELPVLFEDEDLLAVAKPAGLAVHGGSGISFGVIETLRRRHPDWRYLELAHRLDRETSGALLLAKRRRVLAGLHEQFRNGSVHKDYLALVSGTWPKTLDRIDLALHKFLTPQGERRVVVHHEGKASVSRVWLEGVRGDMSLLRVRPETGRTHQIRVHLSHSGFPIMGDDKYGDFELNRRSRRQGLSRMFLHASILEFEHPRQGSRIRLEAPLPAALANFWALLEKGSVHASL